jgi:hypothetical protein
MFYSPMSLPGEVAIPRGEEPHVLTAESGTAGDFGAASKLSATVVQELATQRGRRFNACS